MAQLKAQYFGALSISSLDSDGQRDDVSEAASNLTQTELYQQLSYIEEVASNFFSRRPILLQRDHGVFSELEFGFNQEFDLRVTDLKMDSVLSISVQCIPDIITAEDTYSLEKKKVKGVDFQPLEFRLNRKDDKNSAVRFKPVLYNGEYQITLSSSHGLYAGIYTLTINIGENKTLSPPHRGSTPISQHNVVQTVRVAFNVLPTVRAVPIEVDKPVTGIVAANDIVCYRFVSDDPSKVVGVQLVSIATDAEQGSDPDLYITNRYDGLVAATKDKFVWRSTNVGSDRIDIFPDDVHLASIDTELSPYAASHASHTYVISVHGYKETNQYQLLVTLSPVVPIKALTLPTATIDTAKSITQRSYEEAKRAYSPMDQSSVITSTTGSSVGGGGVSGQVLTTSTPVTVGQYSYYSLRVDLSRRDLIAVTLSKPSSTIAAAVSATSSYYAGGASPKGASSPGSSKGINASSFQQVVRQHNISVQRGRAVYVSDDLQNFIATNSSELSSSDKAAVAANSRPAVVYISATTKYPTEDNFTWKTSAVLQESNGTISLAFVIDCDEWKYVADTCYFSISAQSLLSSSGTTTTTAAAPSDLYTLSVYRQQETDSLDGLQLSRYNMFLDIYSAIDGNILSHKDRSTQIAVSRTSSFKGSVNSDRSFSNIPVDDYSLTYQEIDYVPFIELLRECGAVDGQIFYDLGCGSGKAVVAAALSGIRFVKCVGIEILPTLAYCASEVVNCVVQSTHPEILGSPSMHRGSSYTYGEKTSPLNRENLSRLQRNKSHNRSMMSIQEQRNVAAENSSFSFTNEMKLNLQSLKISVPLLEVRNENILDSDFSDADFVFVSSLCFSDRLVQAIIELGAALKPGSVLVTLKLPEKYDGYFDLTRSVNCKMSWGRATAYVLVKKYDSLSQ